MCKKDAKCVVLYCRKPVYGKVKLSTRRIVKVCEYHWYTLVDGTKAKADKVEQRIKN